MKKALCMVVILSLLISAIAGVTVFADDGIKIVIDGETVTFDQMPVLKNDRTLVPMRGIFETLGATVDWEETTQTVTGTKDDISVTLTIGDTNAKVNGKNVTLDVPAMTISDRTMVPVRFISESLKCDVDWDGDTNTVIITSNAAAQSGMAKLVSNVHRNVPTEFELSNDLNDLMYFTGETIEEQEKKYEEIKQDGELVCTTDKFMDGLQPYNGGYGSYEVVDITGMDFSKALRISCTKVPEKSTGLLIRTSATPEKNTGDGVDKGDVMIMCFRLRLVDGGLEDGRGQIQVQIENPETYKKALFEIAYAKSDQWHMVYMPFRGVENATSIGIRAGFCEQVVEIGGVEIFNFGPDYDLTKLPTETAQYAELEEGAEWRTAALSRIEKERKGDFTVIVKDAQGNVVPNADVTFNMFEHEFQFGNSVNGEIYTNKDYIDKFNMLFNSGGLEHHLKWAPYEKNPSEANKQVEGLAAAGAKYIRGHALIWDKEFGTDGVSYLTPAYIFDDTQMTSKEVYLETIKKHIFEEVKDFENELVEWDVVNEIIRNRNSIDKFGADVFKNIFDYAREAAGDDVKLYYNEGILYEDDTSALEVNRTFESCIKELIDLGCDFDAVGLQSHYDTISDLKMPTEIIARYEEIAKYGKELKVTEYSNNITDRNLQGNYMRDFLIATFAQPEMNGFIMWGFWDGHNHAAFSPFYDTDWGEKPAVQVYKDLVYNKWWTRDAKATTDSEGRASVNGYYGDYDVTVNVNGQTKTVSCAYHKGYQNVLEIVLD